MKPISASIFSILSRINWSLYIQSATMAAMFGVVVWTSAYPLVVGLIASIFMIMAYHGQIAIAHEGWRKEAFKAIAECRYWRWRDDGTPRPVGWKAHMEQIDGYYSLLYEKDKWAALAWAINAEAACTAALALNWRRELDLDVIQSTYKRPAVVAEYQLIKAVNEAGDVVQASQ